MKHCNKCSNDKPDVEFIKASPYCRSCRNAEVARWRAGKKAKAAPKRRGRPPVEEAPMAIAIHDSANPKTDYDLFRAAASSILCSLDQSADVRTLLSTYMAKLSVAAIDIATSQPPPSTIRRQMEAIPEPKPAVPEPEQWMIVNAKTKTYMLVNPEQLGVLKSTNQLADCELHPGSVDILNRYNAALYQPVIYKPPPPVRASSPPALYSIAAHKTAKKIVQDTDTAVAQYCKRHSDYKIVHSGLSLLVADNTSDRLIDKQRYQRVDVSTGEPVSVYSDGDDDSIYKESDEEE